MKQALVALSVLISLPLQAKTLCRVSIEGQVAKKVESPPDGKLAFRASNTTVTLEHVVGFPNRLKFTFLGQTKAAYVVAAFHGDQLRVNPEINGQQMALSCLRK